MVEILNNKVVRTPSPSVSEIRDRLFSFYTSWVNLMNDFDYTDEINIQCAHMLMSKSEILSWSIGATCKIREYRQKEYAKNGSCKV